MTSDRVARGRGKYLGDATMGTTILGRLVHRALMLAFEDQSHRFKEAATRLDLPT